MFGLDRLTRSTRSRSSGGWGVDEIDRARFLNGTTSVPEDITTGLSGKVGRLEDVTSVFASNVAPPSSERATNAEDCDVPLACRTVWLATTYKALSRRSTTIEPWSKPRPKLVGVSAQVRPPFVDRNVMSSDPSCARTTTWPSRSMATHESRQLRPGKSCRCQVSPASNDASAAHVIVPPPPSLRLGSPIWFASETDATMCFESNGSIARYGSTVATVPAPISTERSSPTWIGGPSVPSLTHQEYRQEHANEGDPDDQRHCCGFYTRALASRGLPAFCQPASALRISR